MAGAPSAGQKKRLNAWRRYGMRGRVPGWPIKARAVAVPAVILENQGDAR
jgi:hypothetical protein